MFETADLSDHFLIAMPSMGDPNFSRTVTYMCQHGEEGALGIVINRPTTMKLGEILEQMDIKTQSESVQDLPVFYGGPVQPDRGFVVHQPSGTWDSSLMVSDSMALTTSRDILEAIATGSGPHKSLIALGYAGWGEGQLEREIVENAWLNAPASQSIIFDVPATDRWKSAADLMGIDLNLLSPQAGHS